MKKGSIKVMVGKTGIPRIQEEIGDTVKVYTHEQWQEELKRREAEPAKVEEKIELPDSSDIDDDSEEIQVEKPEKIEAKPVKRGRKAKVE